ncbi:MAG: Gfo/Idh/MocA family oxidoreductase [Chthoniobacterales bacterium]|nr:Gfo/Idh/MocA family oxidoreductase [Chthoniobacterales bacterium]
MNKLKQRVSTAGISRRSFLKAGLATTAGAIFFPYVARSNPLGANRRIRMALIGCGGIMEGHSAWAGSHPEIEVMAVCDVKTPMREKAMAKLKEKNPAIVGYVDYGDVMARNDIDAVIVGTPDHWHAAIAIDAMRTGKDVYVEKPMALTLDESGAMVEAEKRYGRILQVGSQQRSSSEFRQAVNIVRNGWIGDLREIHVNLGGDFPPETLLPEEPVPDNIDYDRWLGPAPWRPYNTNRVLGSYRGGWRIFWDYGSRKNGDWGAHHFDIVQWALGMDESGPVLFVPKGFEGAPEQYHQYADGLKVTASLGQPPSPAGKFMIRFVGTNGEVGVSRGALETTPPGLASKTPSSSEFRAHESNDHRDNWLDSIISRRPPICPATVGGRTFDICALAGISERLERPLRWNPELRQIVDDREAARFAEYPRRAGYPLPV